MAGVTIYGIYSKVTRGTSANTESKNLDTLKAGLKPFFAGQSSTAGLNNTLVNSAQITPPSMMDGTAAGIVNSFGGAVVITPQGLGGTNNGFRIEYQNVPSAVCTQLATGTGAQFAQLTVAGVVVKPLGTTTTVNLTTATTQCNSADAVVMQFDELK